MHPPFASRYLKKDCLNSPSLLTITELQSSDGPLPAFRPTVVEEFSPVRGPKADWRYPDPLFSVGTFRDGGRKLIGATIARQHASPGYVPTFITVDAWAACGLSFDSPEKVVGFFGEVEENLNGSILSPDVHFWLERKTQIHLRALYGPSPWGDDDGCLVISLLDEPRWVHYRFPLGTVVVETDRFLDPDHVFGPLGRHAAGDWEVKNPLDHVDNELAIKLGAIVRSYHKLPSLDELLVTVTTDLGQQETRFECPS